MNANHKDFKHGPVALPPDVTLTQESLRSGGLRKIEWTGVASGREFNEPMGTHPSPFYPATAMGLEMHPLDPNCHQRKLDGGAAAADGGASGGARSRSTTRRKPPVRSWA